LVNLISPEINGVNQVKIFVKADRSTEKERILKSEEYSQIGTVTLVEDVLVVELSIPLQAFGNTSAITVCREN
jgi:hypothetical protein